MMRVCVVCSQRSAGVPCPQRRLGIRGCDQRSLWPQTLCLTRIPPECVMSWLVRAHIIRRVRPAPSRVESSPARSGDAPRSSQKLHASMPTRRAKFDLYRDLGPGPSFVEHPPKIRFVISKKATQISRNFLAVTTCEEPHHNSKISSKILNWGTKDTLTPVSYTL